MIVKSRLIDGFWLFAINCGIVGDMAASIHVQNFIWSKHDCQDWWFKWRFQEISGDTSKNCQNDHKIKKQDAINTNNDNIHSGTTANINNFALWLRIYNIMLSNAEKLFLKRIILFCKGLMCLVKLIVVGKEFLFLWLSHIGCGSSNKKPMYMIIVSLSFELVTSMRVL